MPSVRSRNSTGPVRSPVVVWAMYSDSSGSLSAASSSCWVKVPASRSLTPRAVGAPSAKSTSLRPKVHDGPAGSMTNQVSSSVRRNSSSSCGPDWATPVTSPVVPPRLRNSTSASLLVKAASARVPSPVTIVDSRSWGFAVPGVGIWEPVASTTRRPPST